MADGNAEGIQTARALFDAGNYASAERILSTILKNRPDDISAGNLMSELLLKKGDAKSTLDFCDAWLARHPNAIGIHINRFRALAALNRKRKWQPV